MKNCIIFKYFDTNNLLKRDYFFKMFLDESYFLPILINSEDVTIFYTINFLCCIEVFKFCKCFCVLLALLLHCLRM